MANHVLSSVAFRFKIANCPVNHHFLKKKETLFSHHKEMRFSVTRHVINCQNGFTSIVIMAIPPMPLIVSSLYDLYFSFRFSAFSFLTLAGFAKKDKLSAMTMAAYSAPVVPHQTKYSKYLFKDTDIFARLEKQFISVILLQICRPNNAEDPDTLTDLLLTSSRHSH